MCGIVGYIGSRPARDIVINGLKRLEYRGYDSAGIAISDGQRTEIFKCAGRVRDLEEMVASKDFNGNMAMGHTRWATHGEPNEINAHPQVSCRGHFIVVHNGIIENYMELKERLRKEGQAFLSDTDTEVIPHLIVSFMRKGMSFIDAIRNALSELQGSFAVGIINENERVMVAAKKESPLIVGVGDGEYYIASDAPAVLDRTNRFIFLEDGDMAVFKDKTFSLMNLDGKEIVRPVRTISWTGAMAEKGGYKHFMLKEIFEQPRAISDTLIGRIREEQGEVGFEELELPDVTRIRKIWMVACGTSYHACMIGKHIFEANLRVPVETDIASEFRYRDPIMGSEDMLILVSQSGETADTIAAMREGKRKGAYTLAICNVLGSTLAREADGVVFTHAGPEIGVASTKAFTTQISVLFLLLLNMGKKLGAMDSDTVKDLIVEIKKLPHKIQTILDNSSAVEELARKYMTCKDFLYLGRGVNFPTSLEGALKLKEISYIHAEAYAAGEMKHGPIALIDENLPVAVVSPRDQTYQKSCSNIEEVLTRRGRVILLTDNPAHEMISKVESVIVVPETIYELEPILSVVPLQLLAYYIANLLGTDVDQPRNLAKSVTVE